MITDRQRNSSSTRLLRDQNGASAVEFALICPVLIALVMGIIEFGMILYCKNTAQNAARSVVRQVATNKIKDVQAASAVKPLIAPWVSGSETTEVTQTVPADPTLNEITVGITFSMAKAAPTQFFSFIYGTGKIESRATMQQEDKL